MPLETQEISIGGAERLLTRPGGELSHRAAAGAQCRDRLVAKGLAIAFTVLSQADQQMRQPGAKPPRLHMREFNLVDFDIGRRDCVGLANPLQIFRVENRPEASDYRVQHPAKARADAAPANQKC